MEVRIILSIIVLSLAVGLVLSETIWRDAIDASRNYHNESDEYYHIHAKDLKPVPMKYYWCTFGWIFGLMSVSLTATYYMHIS